MPSPRRLLLVFFLIFSTSGAKAFLTVQESNDISPAGKYKLGIEPQLRTSDGGGANFTGFFDAPVSEEVSVRAHLGAGDTDFYGGGSVKWVPIPDYERQPAVGGKASVIFAHESRNNYFIYRLEPIVSKKFQTEMGSFTPYAALPLMITTGDGDTVTGVQLAAGSEFFTEKADNMTFGAEIATSMKDSFSYVSGFVTIYIDEIRTSQQKK